MEGQAVARKWSIRHKLLLGLGLVVANTTILLAGSLFGLLSYASTTKTIESKEEEHIKAALVRERIAAIRSEQASGGQPAHLDEWLKQAEAALAAYKLELQNTLDRKRDPSHGLYELSVVDGLESEFKKLHVLFADAAKPVANARSMNLLDGAEISESIHKLESLSGDLGQHLVKNIQQLIENARRPFNVSLITMVSTCVLGVLLLIGLSRYFMLWVLHPIKELHQGAELLAKGNFDHRLKVMSGDEMQDLAEAFNEMSDRLQAIYRDLEHQVNERSRQLVRSERLASVGFLAAGVAHEINNPLASIAFCSEALDSRFARVLPRIGSDGDTIAKYLKTIQQEAFRCKAITQRLLEFSRSGESHRENADLTEIVQSVLDMVQHLPNGKGKSIEFNPRGPLSAWVNGQEIKSVVLNLVVNALDSMEVGGRLEINLTRKGELAEIVFADTGCGMDEEVLENLFEPFFTRSRTGKGTGLGLSISHRIISEHGGEIEASSRGPDQGSTFRVLIPCKPAASVMEDEPAHAAAA